MQGRIRRQYVIGRSECSKLVGEAADDAFKRLLKPSIETEFALSSKQDADKEAIGVLPRICVSCFLQPRWGRSV